MDIAVVKIGSSSITQASGELDDTLVILGGEFGRTPYAEVKAGTPVGRDHHHTAFSMLLAGGGVKGGLAYGSSDDDPISLAHLRGRR